MKNVRVFPLYRLAVRCRGTAGDNGSDRFRADKNRSVKKMKSFFSMALVCVLTAAVLSSCSPAPVSSAPASSLQEASSTAASSQIVPSSTSSQALSAQKLVFHPEYMRQTISQYGYIDTDGVLHWNPDFIERELIRDYGLNDCCQSAAGADEKERGSQFLRCTAHP